MLIVGALAVLILVVVAVLLWFLVFRSKSKKVAVEQDDFAPDGQVLTSPAPVANRGEQGLAPPAPAAPQGEQVLASSAPTVPQKAQQPAEPAAGLQFVFESGDLKTFTTLPLSIGRSAQNDLVIDDDTVSASHARVYYDDKARAICIVDLDSLNGLFIDDQPTRRNVLRDGARVRLGNVLLTFRDTGYRRPETA